MNGATAEDWLTQEIRDLLEDGPTGLYQFLWYLNGSSYGLSDQEAIELSQRIARALLDAGQARLYVVRWPDFDIVDGPLPPAFLDEPGSWAEQEQGRFIALVPVDQSP